jgi:hypothetical protein
MAKGEGPSGLATRTLRQIVAARSTAVMSNTAQLSPREVVMRDWLSEELAKFLNEHPSARAPEISDWLVRNGWT